MDPDQDRQNVSERWSVSQSKLFDTLLVSLKQIFEKVSLEKSQQTTTKAWKITQYAKG